MLLLKAKQAPAESEKKRLERVLFLFSTSALNGYFLSFFGMRQVVRCLLFDYFFGQLFAVFQHDLRVKNLLCQGLYIESRYVIVHRFR